MLVGHSHSESDVSSGGAKFFPSTVKSIGPLVALGASLGAWLLNLPPSRVRVSDSPWGVGALAREGGLIKS